jgi:hypothetical protein
MEMTAMFPFDPHTTQLPRTWKEMSLEYKLIAVYHICMMVLFLLGGMLSITSELVITGVLVLGLISLSIRHRRQTGWRWPGVHLHQVAFGLAAIVFGGIFLFAATPLFPPTSPQSLPWYLGGGGIIAFWLLLCFRIIELAEAEFLKRAAPLAEPDDAPMPTHREAGWKRVLRVVCLVFFLAVWLESAASSYYWGITFQGGAHAPTATQTVALRNHGDVIYISAEEKEWLDLLETGRFVGIPLAIGLVVVMQVVAGVKFWPNAPTRQGLPDRHTKDSD